MDIYYGKAQAAYRLGQVLGQGGEGSIYEIDGKPDLVAKIYSAAKFRTSSRSELKEKIQTMIAQPVDPYINGVLTVAWPQDILSDKQGAFVGFTMPRVKSKHHIFAASRERERVMLFPHYTWKTAVLISYNLALAVERVHSVGAVIGDMNQNNIMLDEQGHVTLIDTDSFNMVNKSSGKTYKCTVGVPEMLAPELQGKNLAHTDAAFTKQTDSFSLGIHIFNLLMNNCHPFGFVGMNKSHSSRSSNPIVKNIVTGECPYVNGKKGSPAAPDYRFLPGAVRDLFEQTFKYTAQSACASATITNRPTASQWRNALWEVCNGKLKTCSKAPSELHVYPESYPICPWCEMKKIYTPLSSTPIKHKTTGPQVNYTPTHTVVGSVNGKTSVSPPAGRSGIDWWFLIPCIILGLVSGLVIGPSAAPLVRRHLGITMSGEEMQLILAIIGGGTGFEIVRLTSKRITSPSMWLRAGIFLLIPVATCLAACAVALVIVLIIFLVAIAVYGFVILLGIGFLVALFGG